MNHRSPSDTRVSLHFTSQFYLAWAKRDGEGRDRKMEGRGGRGWGRGEGRDEGQGLGEGSSLSLCQPLSLSLVLLLCQLHSHCIKTSELHPLPYFSASVESTKKTRRPWPWAMGTYKRPSVAARRSLCLLSPPLNVI